jgi:outer membrane lipoprotein-sorting protein
MSIFTSRPVLRWAVPAVAAIAVVGAGVAAKTIAGAAEPTLAPRTAAQLLVDLQTAQLDGLSGTVVEKADLGLPPALTTLAGVLGGSQGSSAFTSLVTGKHTLRVWYSGPDKARVSLLGTGSESDLIKNSNEVWLWDSKSNSAEHGTFTPGTDDKSPKGLPNALPSGLPSGLPTNPQDAANLALNAISPTTTVTTGNTARVAGRDAYELILTPKDGDSLISGVRLAIDAKEHLPLRVQVFAKGVSDPAIEVGFTQVSFTRPDDAQFTFSPPAGAKVSDLKDLFGAGTHAATPKTPDTKGTDDVKRAVIGTGWTSVLVVRTPQQAPAQGADPNTDAKGAQALNGLLGSLPKTGAGTSLKTNLFSVLLTGDGRILVGAVSPEKLAQIATQPAAQLK